MSRQYQQAWCVAHYIFMGHIVNMNCLPVVEEEAPSKHLSHPNREKKPTCF